MPLLDNMQAKADKKAGSKRPIIITPKREIQDGSLVYEKKIQDLQREGRQHDDIAVLHVLLDTLHGLLPIAEKQYAEYSTHTNASAVTNLSNVLRETLNDIQALEDFSKRADLISDFITKQYRELLQNLVTDLFTAQKAIQAKPNLADDELTKIRNTAAKRFGESDKTVRSHITRLLQVKT